MDLIVAHPAGTLPQKLPPAELKAAYRLCDCDEVTHEALLAGVRADTLARVASEPGAVLLVHDTTELDYAGLLSLSDVLGPIGNGGQRGYLCHNTLAVAADGRVLGLVNQILHRRRPEPAGEGVAAKRQRETRESLLWIRGVADLPAESRLIDVADRAADTFEFLERLRAGGRGFVVRSNHDRSATVGHADGGAATKLHAHMRTLVSLGSRRLRVSPKPGRPAREIELQISSAPMRLVAPHVKRGLHGRDPLDIWCVRLWEVGGALERFLLCGSPADGFERAAEIAGWYEKRWTVEDFHKGMKTGCGVETLQFTDEGRLQPMILMLSAAAAVMLMLRGLAADPASAARPAESVMPPQHVRVLSVWRHRRERALTVGEFVKALARLGGHQNRRGDGPPGWQTLWRGWMRLDAMLQYAAASQRCG